MFNVLTRERGSIWLPFISYSLEHSRRYSLCIEGMCSDSSYYLHETIPSDAVLDGPWQSHRPCSVDLKVVMASPEECVPDVKISNLETGAKIICSHSCIENPMWVNSSWTVPLMLKGLSGPADIRSLSSGKMTASVSLIVDRNLM